MNFLKLKFAISGKGCINKCYSFYALQDLYDFLFGRNKIGGKMTNMENRLKDLCLFHLKNIRLHICT